MRWTGRIPLLPVVFSAALTSAERLRRLSHGLRMPSPLVIVGLSRLAMLRGPADIDLIRTAEDDPGSRRLPNSPAAFLIIGVIVALVAAGGYLFVRRARPVPPATVATGAPPAVKVQQEAAQITLPPLEDTDGLVRQLVGELLSHPVIAAWLTTDRLIVNFVVATHRITEGQSPAAELKA